MSRPEIRFGIAPFLVISLTLTLVLFWPAAIGRKLLAPLDIPANFFSKFKYVDPAANGVPANHYMIDLILGDVSRNLLVHQAWERGEVPWWDPFTDGGKPLPAEANSVNVSDPFKWPLFRLLPFELAYNWVRIVPFLISGLGAFCLLRYFGFAFAPALWGGLLYQFAGCNAVMFSGPTAQASAAYFPVLWILWDRGASQGRLLWFALAGMAAALVFLSGNLQSHSYPFLLGIAFVLGYGWRRWRRFTFLAGGVALALGLGLCLASPVLLSQIELFFLSARKVVPELDVKQFGTGTMALSSVFPWILGTFRTLDVSKIFGQYALGFWTFIGSAALLIAALGAWPRDESGGSRRDRKRTAIALVITYWVVCSTPLIRFFYTRTAWLAVLGLIVLFALGWETLAAREVARRKVGWAIVAFALVLGLGINLAGAVIYPRFQARIEKYVLDKDGSNNRLDEARALRRFQVGNLVNEVTFKNPETALSFLAILGLGLFLIRVPAARGACLHAILILSTLPLLVFVHRFIPMHPVSLWTRIREGGPEQRRVAQAAQAGHLRVRESAPGTHEFVFPGALSQLFGVHVLHGHTSLMLSNAGWIADRPGHADPALHDLEYRSPVRGLEQGELTARTNGPPARFHWKDAAQGREVSVADESLRTLTLTFGPGGAGDLIRTDSYYPGWHPRDSSTGATVSFEPPCFSRIHVPADLTRLELVYGPRTWRWGMALAASGGVLLAFLLVSGSRTRCGTTPAVSS
jgi:hypothetical protein